MTVINKIEIDNIRFFPNDIKLAIINNLPIEKKLRVVMVVSNPCQYAKRYILAREFIQRMERDESSVELYIVELVYTQYYRDFYLTSAGHPRHLQIRTHTAPLWHKENMINMAVRTLFPPDWKAFAWIDADVEFESPTWATDTLKILNGTKDVVQLFSHCVDMDSNGLSMTTFSSFGYNLSKGLPYCAKSGANYFHPGYAWAMTRRAYEKIGGLYERSILGSGDHMMAMSFIGKADVSLHSDCTEDYKRSIQEFQERARNLRIGYVPGVIRHFFHGSKKNRKYTERWKILVDNKYSPQMHVYRLENGLLAPVEEICPSQLLTDIMDYFQQRNEDE